VAEVQRTWMQLQMAWNASDVRTCHLSSQLCEAGGVRVPLPSLPSSFFPLRLVPILFLRDSRSICSFNDSSFTMLEEH